MARFERLWIPASAGIMFVPIARDPINMLYILFIPFRVAVTPGIVQLLQLPGLSLRLHPGFPRGRVQNLCMTRREGVFLMVLLESSTFCKAVEKS